VQQRLNAVLLRHGRVWRGGSKWTYAHRAWVDKQVFPAKGIGPVSLEERIRFHREIRAGQEVAVSCVFTWGEGKSFRIEQEIRLPDGTLAAEITNVGGLLDLEDRRLIRDPG